MAKETVIDRYFLGSDEAYSFHIKNEGETVSLDIAVWTLSWRVRKIRSYPTAQQVLQATVVLEKSTGGAGIVIGGLFNSDPTTNLQRAVVTVEDTDTDTLKPGSYQYELKRIDVGFETVLAYGRIEFIQGVHTA